MGDAVRDFWLWLVGAPWRVWPAALLMLVGAGRVLREMRHLGRWLHPVENGPLVWAHGIRRWGSGLCLFLLGAAWYWQQVWLLVFAGVIYLDTFGEYGTALTALEREEQAKGRAPARE